jgi:hypothetical protein
VKSHWHSSWLEVGVSVREVSMSRIVKEIKVEMNVVTSPPRLSLPVQA